MQIKTSQCTAPSPEAGTSLSAPRTLAEALLPLATCLKGSNALPSRVPMPASTVRGCSFQRPGSNACWSPWTVLKIPCQEAANPWIGQQTVHPSGNHECPRASQPTDGSSQVWKLSSRTEGLKVEPTPSTATFLCTGLQPWQKNMCPDTTSLR